jgi:hypothetical protein
MVVSRLSLKRIMARPMKAAVIRGGSVALKLSDAASAAPGQHVQLRQDRGGEPPVRRDFADEPAEAAHQIVDVSVFADRTFGSHRRSRVTNLKVNRQSRIAVRRQARIGVIIVVEHDDLDDTFAKRSKDSAIESELSRSS